jgi:hypothetical protein
MNVKEALTKVFGFEVDHESGWDASMGKWGPMKSNPITIVRTGYMQTYSGDRGLLASNMDSEVLYLDHYGVMGVMAFKMRNKQWALFALNLLGYTNTLIRVRDSKLLSVYLQQKKAFQQGEQYSQSNDNFDSWITLKTIGGKRL